MSVIRIFLSKMNFYDKNTCLGKEIIKEKKIQKVVYTGL